MKPSIMPLMQGDMINRANLFRFINEFINAMEMPNGYYMEFGILNGECMIDAYRQFRGTIHHYIGFDSFEGLPALSNDDLLASDYSKCFYKGNFKSMEIDYVKRNILESCRMEESELTLVPGVFSQTFEHFNKETLRNLGSPLVIYIDCDLYSSSVDVLNFIDDLIITGTWILFDDYWTYRGSPQHGEQRAIHEWLNSHNRIGLSDYCNYRGWGKAFIAYEK